LEVRKKEQQRRFETRISDPVRQWKLSPMDLESFDRWYEYARVRDKMRKPPIRSTRRGVSFVRKKKAWLACIFHLLSLIPYRKVLQEKVKLPKRNNTHL
jgi:polyphosphate kinase 2 (PPK2 family)